jgi:hypothetical protein
MNTSLWEKLPNDLIRKIIEDSEPSIDVQLAFKIKPKKIYDTYFFAYNKIDWLLGTRTPLIYKYSTNSLHDFSRRGFHIVKRPVYLDYVNQSITLFNINEEYYSLEVYSPDGQFMSCPHHNDTFTTSKSILFKN